LKPCFIVCYSPVREIITFYLSCLDRCCW